MDESMLIAALALDAAGMKPAQIAKLLSVTTSNVKAALAAIKALPAV